MALSSPSESNAPLTAELAQVFARMSGLLLSTETVATALALITAVAKQTVPGTTGAGITLVDPNGERTTTAATDELVRRADALQYELELGPCLTAWADRVVVRIDDLVQDERWPAWSGQVSKWGLRASLSAPLVAGAEALGAVKVYGHTPQTYGDQEERLLTMFATQATMLLTNMRTAADAERISDQLRDSVRAREVIILAKGIIMARDGVDERMAFLALADTARQQRVTLRQAAERLATSTVRRRR